MRGTWATALALSLFSLFSVNAAPKWSLPEGVKTVEVNGYDLAYLEAGSGPALILVHGTFTDLRYWTLQMKEFGGRYRVFALSLRHYFPEKWDGQGSNFSIQQHADDVAEFIRKMNLGKVHLLGHSRGGAVALHAARRNPELIRSLILADTGGAENLLPATPESQKVASDGEKLRASMRQAVTAGSFDAAGKLLLEFVNGPGAWDQLSPDRKQRVLDNVVTGIVFDPRPAMDCQDLKNFDFPQLYVTGERSPKRYHMMIEALRQCRAAPEPVIIPGAAHTMNVQNARAFNSAVLEFLSSN